MGFDSGEHRYNNLSNLNIWMYFLAQHLYIGGATIEPYHQFTKVQMLMPSMKH